VSEKLFNVGIKGVIMKDNKVLILKGAPGKDIWELPGGRVDKNETIQQTLTRELCEELPNINNIVVHEILNAYRVHKDIKEGVSLVLIFYRVIAEFNGDPQLSHEHSNYKWSSKEEALNLLQESSLKAVVTAFETEQK
jgi:8-oxo-dGTP pyrophosphatase MutT (NUDIX family)